MSYLNHLPRDLRCALLYYISPLTIVPLFSIDQFRKILITDQFYKDKLRTNFQNDYIDNLPLDHYRYLLFKAFSNFYQDYKKTLLNRHRKKIDDQYGSQKDKVLERKQELISRMNVTNTEYSERYQRIANTPSTRKFYHVEHIKLLKQCDAQLETLNRKRYKLVTKKNEKLDEKFKVIDDHLEQISKFLYPGNNQTIKPVFKYQEIVVDAEHMQHVNFYMFSSLYNFLTEVLGKNPELTHGMLIYVKHKDKTYSYYDFLLWVDIINRDFHYTKKAIIPSVDPWNKVEAAALESMYNANFLFSPHHQWEHEYHTSHRYY